MEYVSSAVVNPLSANPTKWSNTLKQVVDNRPKQMTNCLNVFHLFMGLALKGLKFVLECLIDSF